MAIEKLSYLYDRDSKGRFIVGNKYRAGVGNQRARKYSRYLSAELLEPEEKTDTKNRDSKGRFVRGNEYRFQRGNKMSMGYEHDNWAGEKAYDIFGDVVADCRVVRACLNRIARRRRKAERYDTDADRAAIAQSIRDSVAFQIPRMVYLIDARFYRRSALPQELAWRVETLLQDYFAVCDETLLQDFSAVYNCPERPEHPDDDD